MTSNSAPQSSGGIGFFGLLGLLFIALKLTGVITWSWWLVTLPLWGGLALILTTLLVATFVVLAACSAQAMRRK